MQIIIYTITDCTFSQAEKEYLKSKSLTFEEKNLEANKEFLTEMLAVSNNFAGTPVTKITKDDGQIIVIKGFTPEEFDKALGFAPAERPSQQPTSPQAVSAATPSSVAPPIQAPVQNGMPSTVTDSSVTAPSPAMIQPQPPQAIVMPTSSDQSIQQPPAQQAPQPVNPPPTDQGVTMSAEDTQQAIAAALQNAQQPPQQPVQS